MSLQSTQKLPDINTQFADWYNDIVYKAELADLAPVKGCIVIRPYGYALWENITQIVDGKIKKAGAQNAAFPLLIPESFLKREAKHVEGFSPELAVVTIAGGKELEEPLVVRPTSETIIHHMFAQWIKSWRDLPLKVNQWCSVVRWEMRTRPFLRTTEFWWQEGHTAHETEKEAHEMAELMLKEYVDLIENYLAIPVIAAKKSESEKFAGADMTLTMEGLMQDGRALQMGTSHVISQSFAQAFGIQYQDREGGLSYPYLTSWAVTSRLIGAVVMVHGDQKGLVMPPKVAPIQVVIVPIYKGDDKESVRAAALKIKEQLEGQFRIRVDDDETETPGAKFYKWEMKGVPVRIEIGPRDIQNNVAVVADRLGLAKGAHALDVLSQVVGERLDAIQNELYARAIARRKDMWYHREKLSEFADDLENKGGLFQTGWCESGECEAHIKNHKATIRCVLPEKTFAVCCVCGKPSIADIVVAKAY